MGREGLSQRRLAERIGLHPTDLSKIMNGTVAEFSQERLERLLNNLGCEIEITVRRATNDHTATTHVNSSDLMESVTQQQ